MRGCAAECGTLGSAQRRRDLTDWLGQSGAPFGAPFLLYSTEAVRVISRQRAPNGAAPVVPPGGARSAARVTPGGFFHLGGGLPARAMVVPYWHRPRGLV